MSNITIGMDIGSSDGDYSTVTYWKKPSLLRRLLRRVGLDKSRWERQLVKIVEIRKEQS